MNSTSHLHWHLEGGGQRPGHRGDYKCDCEGHDGPAETKGSQETAVSVFLLILRSL